MYGAQTKQYACCVASQFENDVEMYGAQTSIIAQKTIASLRMM